MKISKLLLVFYIILVPIMIVPKIHIFEQKIQYSDIVIAFFLLYMILEVIQGRVKLTKIPFFPVLIFMLITFFISLGRHIYNIIGFIDYFSILYLGIVYILIVLAVRDKKELGFYIKTWIWVSTFICVIGIIGYITAFISGKNNLFVPKLNLLSEIALFPKVLSWDIRLSATCRNPNMFASYLIVGVLFLIIAIKQNMIDGRKYKIYIYLLFLHILAAFLTKSRVNASILLLVSVATFILMPPKKFIFLKIITFLFTLFYIILTITTLFIWVFPIESYQFKINTQHNIYYLLSEASVKIWKDHPFFGIGLGRYNSKVDEYFNWEEARISLPDPDNPAWKRKDPHSTYFGWAAETGILGLSAILIFFMCHLIFAYRADETKILSSGVIAFLIAGLSLDIVTLRHFWFLLGINGVYINFKNI